MVIAIKDISLTSAITGDQSSDILSILAILAHMPDQNVRTRPKPNAFKMLFQTARSLGVVIIFCRSVIFSLVRY